MPKCDFKKVEITLRHGCSVNLQHIFRTPIPRTSLDKSFEETFQHSLDICDIIHFLFKLKCDGSTRSGRLQKAKLLELAVDYLRSMKGDSQTGSSKFEGKFVLT